MLRRLSVAAALVAAGAAALPADAAPSVKTYYLANPGACDPDFTPVLQPTPAANSEECTASVVANGNGLVSAESYATSKTTFKIDASKKVSGVIHVMCQQVIGVNAQTARNAGYVDLAVTVKLDSTKLGTLTIASPVLPTMTVATPFEYAVPAALKGKTVKKAVIDVVWKTTVGMCAISYSDGGQSLVKIPVR